MSLSVSQVLSAGQTVKYSDVGNFLRVMSATANITVRVFKTGQVMTEIVAVGAGYAEEFDQNFDAVEIYSATAQTVQIVLRLGSKVYFDTPPVGNVNITSQNPPQTSGANSLATVTSTAAQLVAANTERQYLMIQNNDSAGIVFINFGGTATVSNGLKIGAGQSFVMESNLLTAAISAIGNIDSNANIVIVTG